MYNEEFLQEQALKRGWFKYYSLLRPVGIGTHPTNGMIDFVNYNCRKDIEGFRVWAILFYERELTEKELENYEMVIA